MSEWEEWLLAFLEVANEMMDEMEAHSCDSPCDTCEHNDTLEEEER